MSFCSRPLLVCSMSRCPYATKYHNCIRQTVFREIFILELQGLPWYLKRQNPLAPKPCFLSQAWTKPDPHAHHLWPKTFCCDTFAVVSNVICCALFLRDLRVASRVLQHGSMMLGTSVWCHPMTSAMLTCAMSSPLPTFVPPSPDPMGVPLRYPSSLASLPGEKAQAGTLLHPACHTDNIPWHKKFVCLCVFSVANISVVTADCNQVSLSGLCCLQRLVVHETAVLNQAVARVQHQSWLVTLSHLQRHCFRQQGFCTKVFPCRMQAGIFHWMCHDCIAVLEAHTHTHIVRHCQQQVQSVTCMSCLAQITVRVSTHAWPLQVTKVKKALLWHPWIHRQQAMMIQVTL